MVETITSFVAGSGCIPVGGPGRPTIVISAPPSRSKCRIERDVKSPTIQSPVTMSVANEKK